MDLLLKIHIIIIIIAIITIGIIIYVGNHDKTIIIDNYKKDVRSDLLKITCDELKDSMYYEEYIHNKEKYLKSEIEIVIEKQVQIKLAECGDLK